MPLGSVAIMLLPRKRAVSATVASNTPSGSAARLLPFKSRKIRPALWAKRSLDSDVI
jgi:hypothetical protein